MSLTLSMLSCNGITSSSQAITTTARNSSPFARCMVLIETQPLLVSTCSSRILKVIPDTLTADSARSIWAADLTNTPISCGSTPAFVCSANHAPTSLISSFSVVNVLMTGGGPLKTEMVSSLLSVWPSTSTVWGSSNRSACWRI